MKVRYCTKVNYNIKLEVKNIEYKGGFIITYICTQQ